MSRGIVNEIYRDTYLKITFFPFPVRKTADFIGKPLYFTAQVYNLF